MSSRFFSQTKNVFAVTALVALLAPSLTLAADPAGIADPSVRAVSRGQFLDWTLRTFDISTQKKTCKLPYLRVPARYQSILCAAQDQKLLTAFDSNMVVTRSITAGEALKILTTLTKKSDNADLSAFTDAPKDSTGIAAVKNAITNRWLQPQSSTQFGLTRPLTGAQVLSMLQSATDQNPVKQTIKITVPPPSSTSQSAPSSALLNSVWQLINRDYLKATSIDQQEVNYKMIEGLVESLGDPYSTFFRPSSADAFATQIKGEVTGIGAHVEMKDGFLTIVSPLPGSPAEKAGLKPGDQIIEADGNALKGLDLNKAVEYIRGDKGTSVKLKIQRGTDQLIISVLRDVVTIPEIDISWNGDIAIVKIVQFGDTTDTRIRSLLTQVAVQKPRGIVLDLRNNPGGLLHAADVVVGSFMPKGTVVAQVKGRTESSKEVTGDEPVIDAGTNLVVLVNSGSASASEIVAGALQDYKRAKIVGTTTFGKGTVQEVLTFQTGEALKLTIAEWLTPLGRAINKIGVTPDIVLTETDADQQLARAVNLAKN